MSYTLHVVIPDETREGLDKVQGLLEIRNPDHHSTLSDAARATLENGLKAMGVMQGDPENVAATVEGDPF